MSLSRRVGHDQAVGPAAEPFPQRRAVGQPLDAAEGRVEVADLGKLARAVFGLQPEDEGVGAAQPGLGVERPAPADWNWADDTIGYPDADGNIVVQPAP